MADGTTRLALILSAIDRTAGAWNSIQGRMRGFEAVSRGTAVAGKGVGMAVAGGMIAAQAAIGAATFAFSKLQSGFQGAMDSQTSQFSTASGLVGAFGLTFDEATASIDRMTESLVKQAKILPGSAGDYVKLSRAISDDVGAAFVDATGKISDIGGFEKALGSISASVGALGVTSKTDTNNVGLSLSRALGGASRAQLNDLAFFQNNRSFLNLVDKATGGMELSDMTVQERVKVIEKVAKQLAGSDEYLKRSGQLLDSKISTLASDLFDADFGLFGLNRDLDPIVKGKQSVLTSIGNTFDKVFGDGGVMGKLGRIFKEISFDPMLVLSQALDAINRGVDVVLPWLERAASFIDSGGKLSELARVVPTWFGGTVDKLFEYGDKVRMSVFNAINKFDFGKFFESFRGVLDNVVGFVSGMINRSFAASRQMFETIDFQKLGEAFGTLIADLVIAIIDTLARVNWGQVIVVVAETAWNVLKFVLGTISGITVRIIGALGGLAASAVGGIGSAIQSFFAGTVAKISNFFAMADHAMREKAAQAVAWIPFVGNDIAAKIAPASPVQGVAKYMGNIPAIPASGGLFDAITTEMRNKPSGSSLAIANTSEAIIPAGMMKGLLGGRGATNYNTFNIQSSDPKAVAQEVLAILESLTQSGVNANLAYDFT